MSRWIILIVLGILFFIGIFFSGAPFEYFKSLVGNNYALSAIVFTLLMCLSVVVAPVASLPLLPASAPLLGPWQAALLAVLGWSLGAAMVFVISRFAGVPLLKRFAPRMDSKLQHLIPEKNAFWWMLLLRMLIPVDVLSYALPLIPTVRFVPYMLATMLGITPFAFIFSYAGATLIEREFHKLIGLLGLGVVIFLLGHYAIQRKNP